MNILYINHYAGSPKMGMEFRPYYLSKEWVKMGHNVAIIAADYSHLRIKNPNVKKDFQEEIIDGIRYLWVKTKTYSGNGVDRAITMYQFVHKIKKNAKKIIDMYDPDVVITSSTYPLDTYAGQKLKKLKPNLCLIHEIHDMWPVSLIEISGMSKYNPFAIAMQIGENSFCRKSDYVCSLLPNAKDYLIKHGMAEKKFFHIPNGIVIEEWEKPVPLPNDYIALFEKLHTAGKFIICFFGSHTISYNLDCFVESIKETSLPVCGVFIGDGIHKKELIRKSKGSKNRMYFLDPIPKAAIPSLFDFVDAVYVGSVENKSDRFGICMNKLFDSMMGGKPILYAVNAPNNYILDYNCGVSVKPSNTEELKKGIEKLYNASKEERVLMGCNGRKAIKSNFVYNKLAEEFIKNIERGTKNEK